MNGYQLANGGDFALSYAVRNDGTQIILAQEAATQPAQIDLVQCAPADAPEGCGVLLSQAPMAGPLGGYWRPQWVTTTPNNHTQIYWVNFNGGTSEDFAIWDVDANGNVTRRAGVVVGYAMAVAASPFSGADAKLRVLGSGVGFSTPWTLYTVDILDHWAVTSVTLNEY